MLTYRFHVPCVWSLPEHPFRQLHWPHVLHVQLSRSQQTARYVYYTWPLYRHKYCHVLFLIVSVFSGHQNSSFYVKSCVSPDGCYLLSGSSCGNAFIWQVGKKTFFHVVYICKFFLEVPHHLELNILSWHAYSAYHSTLHSLHIGCWRQLRWGCYFIISCKPPLLVIESHPLIIDWSAWNCSSDADWTH